MQHFASFSNAVICAFYVLCLLFSTGLAQGPAQIDEEPASNSSAIDVEDEAEEEPSDELDSGEEPVPPEILAQIESEFKRLGSENFKDREEATTKLIAIGPQVVPVLQTQSTISTDPEVLARARLVIDHVEQSGLPARIESFMKAPNEIEQHKFYGWKSFAEIAGTNRVARRIFTEMLPRHARFCNEELTIEQLIELQHETVRTLTGELRAFNETTVADAVVLQLLMIRLQDKVSGDLESLTARLVSFAPYSSELNIGKGAKTLKRITSRWINSARATPSKGLLVSLHYQIPEGAVLARRVLNQGPADDIDFNLAMQAILVFGNADDLLIVERYFANDRAVFKEANVVDGSIVELEQQYRDLALATAVHLRGWTMTDFFSRAEPHHLRGYNPQSLRFFSADVEKERNAAFERYHAAVNGLSKP